jgi:hypothetical protein
MALLSALAPSPMNRRHTVGLSLRPSQRTSSIRIEPSIRHIQPDNNSADDD